jgi:hypothetical protein
VEAKEGILNSLLVEELFFFVIMWASGGCDPRREMRFEYSIIVGIFCSALFCSLL